MENRHRLRIVPDHDLRTGAYASQERSKVARGPRLRDVDDRACHGIRMRGTSLRRWASSTGCGLMPSG